MRYGPQVEFIKHAIACPKHGKTHCAAFLMPEPYEAQVAHYECGHCWDDAGRPNKTEWRGERRPLDQPLCELCGEPMPAGEDMFNYHGYSGPCPKPPLNALPTGTVPRSDEEKSNV